jgi:predicted nucleotidyltransferase component of viral defense system
MISVEQLKVFAKKLKINEAIVAREFVQVTFLKEMYEQRFSKEVFFKGGTAIRLIYGGKRFSEDLDFTVTTKDTEFMEKINPFFGQLSKKYPFVFKEKDTLVGKTFLLTAKIPGLKSNTFVKLDFSLRENVVDPTQEFLKTDYPITVQSFINCLSKNEIFAEKIRAVLRREKHRDLYDLWVLYGLGASPDMNIINKKLSFYGENFKKSDLIDSLHKFKKDDFILDLKPFVSIDDRAKLGELFDFINKYLDDSFRKLPV